MKRPRPPKARPLATGAMPLCPPCNEGQFSASGSGGLRIIPVPKRRRPR